MILDGKFDFGIPDITNSTAVTAGVNVYDAGSSKILFGAEENLWLVWKTVLTADAAPSIKVDFVGSDNVDLDPDNNEAVGNIILGSTGVVDVTEDGTDIASGEVVEGAFRLMKQTAARRYYGILVTLGGTAPDTVAATSYAHLVKDYQSMMRGVQAAVPAT